MSSELETVEPQPLSGEVFKHIKGLKFSRNDYKFLTFAPTPTLSTIIRAGANLRHRPDEALVPIPVYLTDEQKSNFGNQVLESMINGSISRPPVADSIPSFTCLYPEALDTCAMAEPAFVSVLEDIGEELDTNRYIQQLPLADVVTQNGKPILLSKYVGIRTCLALSDISIDGLTYPAGSIARPIFNSKAVKKAESERGKRAYNTYDVSDVTSLGFMRLSMFAFPLDQRTAWDGVYARERSQDEMSLLSTKMITERIEEVLEN